MPRTKVPYTVVSWFGIYICSLYCYRERSPTPRNFAKVRIIFFMRTRPLLYASSEGVLEVSVSLPRQKLLVSAGIEPNYRVKPWEVLFEQHRGGERGKLNMLICLASVCCRTFGRHWTSHVRFNDVPSRSRISTGW